MSFQTRIEDHVGTLASADTTFMTDVLTDGARVVIDILVNKSSDRVEIYAVEKSDAGSGVDITSGKPFSAHKANYPARRIPTEMRAMAVDADSIHYALSTDPVWYLEKNKAYVLPGGGTIRWVDYPTVLYSDSTVTNYPPEGYDAMVLYASQRYLIRILSDLTTSTLGGLSFSFPNTIVPPSSPSFTWTDAQIETIGLSLVSFNDTLSFNPPVFSGSYTNMDTALGNQDVELAQGFNQKIQSQLGQYSQDLQNSVSQFQKDLQVYQSNLQKAIENARLDSQRLSEQARLTTDANLQNEIQTLNKQVQEYQALLGKYQGEVSSYGTQVQKEVSRVQSLIGLYQAQSQNYALILENLRKEFQLSLESL